MCGSHYFKCMGEGVLLTERERDLSVMTKPLLLSFVPTHCAMYMYCCLSVFCVLCSVLFSVAEGGEIVELAQDRAVPQGAQATRADKTC